MTRAITRRIYAFVVLVGSLSLLASVSLRISSSLPKWGVEVPKTPHDTAPRLDGDNTLNPTPLTKRFRTCVPRHSQSIPGLFTPGQYQLSVADLSIGGGKNQPNNTETTKRLIYLHIFKNGGTTMNHVMTELMGGTYLTHVEIGMSQVEKTLYNVQDWNSTHGKLFRFALVRDPVARVVSAYHEIMVRKCHHKEPCFPTNGNSNDNHNATAVKALQLEELRSYLQLVQKGNFDSIAAGHHLWLQVSFVYHANNLQPYPMEYIGRFEQIDQQIDLLLGPYSNNHNGNDTGNGSSSSLSSSLPRGRYYEPFPGKLRKQDLTPEILLLICDIYKDDFCCFDYDFPEVCRQQNSKMTDCSDNFNQKTAGTGTVE